ncbi:DUF2911 domain-containing protein [Mucilaginibacter panaciglaebae]|uniref:DUF2911 domain-containing protein n=1 Tax=Mucilaginibacter panaciglaebae TaxID=502331 RepID=A0ABP7X516_9SPHI
MKKTIICLAVLLSLGVFTVTAQDLTIPQPSTPQTIIQGFGLGQVTLTYSRPSVKGRKIFGYMEPYGKVWRTGANWATTIKFTDDVTMEGKSVAAGEYGLFSIPGQKEWIFILNKTSKQWGAYTYKESDDVIRFTVPVKTTSALTETLTFDFANATPTDCFLQLNWEHVQTGLHLKIDVDTKVMANIDRAMQSDKKPYYSAAIYYYNNNKDLKKALEWMEVQDKAQPNSDNIKYWIARIKLKMGDKKGAIATATEGLNLATKANDVEYARMNKEVLADAAK